MPRVSIIIPTLGKRPEMLKEAIASIEAQTIPCEVIVVKDPDKSFGNQQRKINKGIRQSSGEFYAFMGDDDRLKPDFAEKMLQEFEKDPELDIVTSLFETFGSESGVHGPDRFPLCSTLVRRSMYDKTKGFDEEVPIGCDADFYFQCFELGAKWKKIPDILYESRVHPEQYSLIGDWGDYKEIIRKKYNGKYSDV